VELLTPVCKAYSSDRGFEVCTWSVQILAGYGYSREFPVEQYLRDEKVTSIYEGTNGIQAIDLATRKIGMKKGRVFQSFIEAVEAVMERAGNSQDLLPYVALMERYKATLEEGTRHLMEEMRSGDAGLALSKATRFLEFFGDITLAWLWLWQMSLAQEKLAAALEQRGETQEQFDIRSPQDSELAFYAGKVQTGKFYLERIMPAVFGKIEEIKSKGENFLDLAVECL
jgi:hypothetical protein